MPASRRWEKNNPGSEHIVHSSASCTAGTPAALGIMVPNVAAARQWRARGMRYIAIGMENILAPAAREYLKTAREA